MEWKNPSWLHTYISKHMCYVSFDKCVPVKHYRKDIASFDLCLCIPIKVFIGWSVYSGNLIWSVYSGKIKAYLRMILKFSFLLLQPEYLHFYFAFQPFYFSAISHKIKYPSLFCINKSVCINGIQYTWKTCLKACNHNINTSRDPALSATV